MEEVLRKNKLSFQNIEDQKESVPWVRRQLLGFMFSCCCISGLCILLCVCPFPKETAFSQQWVGVCFPAHKYDWAWSPLKMFRLTWHNIWRSQLPTFCKLECPPRPKSSSWCLCAHISPGCKVKYQHQKLALCLDGGYSFHFSSRLINDTNCTSNHLSIISSRQQMIP